MLNYLTLFSYLLVNSQGGQDGILNPFNYYTLPLADWISAAVNFIVDNFRPFFQALRFPISLVLDRIEWVFISIPPLIFLFIIGLVGWQLAGRGVAIYSVAALILIGLIGAWKQAMVTLSMVVTAVVFCILIGIPLGIICARSDRSWKVVRPLLDIMQTTPLFVYLVPVVMLFGIGKVPGVIATFIFATPPLIRLTNLGIRQVSAEVVEAAVAFGSTPLQVLSEVQFPLALPTILAGLNQTILFALGMSVITSMIAVEGLGQIVLEGVGRLDVGLAAVGGLSIVLLAIMLDRISQAVGQVNPQISWQKRGKIGFLFSVSLATLVASLLVNSIAYQSTHNTTTKSETSASTTVLPGSGVRVRPGAGYAAESRFIPEIVNIGLKKLGYEVEDIKQLTPSAVYVALANNDLDILALHWEYLFARFFEKNGGKTKLEVVGDVTNNLLQGYQIDKKTAVQYNITNIEQLRNPKIANFFDSDGNGKANLFGCYPGTACELIIDHHLKAYGLQDTVEHVKGEPSVLIAETLARYKQRKPVLFFAYTPHWITLELKPGNDVVWLEVPFTSLPKEIGNFTKKDTSAGGKNLGFAVDRIRIVANKNFLERQPAARRFFELVQVPLEDVSAQQKLMREGENRPKDIRLHAEKWVQKNQEQFNRWVEEASQAGQGTK